MSIIDLLRRKPKYVSADDEILENFVHAYPEMQELNATPREMLLFLRNFSHEARDVFWAMEDERRIKLGEALKSRDFSSLSPKEKAIFDPNFFAERQEVL